MEPNPEAIAWYVEEAQRLLEDQQRRTELLRTRGGQIAGFAAAVLALIGGNVGTVLEAEGSARVALGLTLLVAAVCVFASVAVAIWGVIKPRPFALLVADEIAIYASDHFLFEPDLWRVQVRALRALEEVARQAQEDEDAAAGAVMVALYALLVGLGLSLVSLGTLTVELI